MTATRAARASGDGALLALLGAAGFASVASTRLCDAMVPALALAFGTSTHDAAAVISSYAIAYSVMQLVCGPLGDRFGKPQVIGLAAACCALTTACAALAPSLPVLVLARAAMGACTAAIVPLTVAWIADTVPLAQRQQTLARYSGYTVFGLVLGPLLGGLLTQLLSWRVAFQPSRSGRRMSIRMRSGDCARAIDRPSAASAAMSTSKPLRSSRRESMSRFSSLSSTSRIRRCCDMLPPWTDERRRG